MLNQQAIAQHICHLLRELGEEEREGLAETPERYARFIDAWLTKGDTPNFRMTTFESEGMDQMVVQTDIPFYSLCEHHLLPFFGTAVVAYIPDKKIVGLSKLARLVQFYASRPQNQERITKQVAQFLQGHLSPLGVGVVLRARHMCMEMRGVKVHGAETMTSYILGSIRDDAATRAEFFNLANKGA